MDLNLHNVKRINVSVSDTTGAVTIRFEQDITPMIESAPIRTTSEITFYPLKDERIEVRLGDD